MSSDALARSYDQTPYKSEAYSFTHPARMSALAALLGLDAPDVRTCRVLEVGCASGGNLIPMAALPDARFVGIDISERQIADGQDVLRRLALDNVDLRTMDIIEAASLGRFDYIIAHGVYSWVPPDVQRQLLRLCSDNLADNGVAFVSFNALPGWQTRGAVREMLKLRTRGISRSSARVTAARELIDAFTSAFAMQPTPFAQLMKEELERAGKAEPSYFLHEYLEDFNEALYFDEFMSRAQSSGLQYLWEAEPHVTTLEQFPPTVRESLTRLSRDVIELEQWIDVLKRSAFRKTLLCKQSVVLDRTGGSARYERLHALGAIRPSDAGFVTRGGRVISTTDAQVVKALHAIAEAWPNTISFDGLLRNIAAPHDLAARRRLGEMLVQLMLIDALELYTHPATAAKAAPAQPN